MKKWLLGCLLLAVLTGCRAAPETSDDHSADDLIVVGLSQVVAESDWRFHPAQNV